MKKAEFIMTLLGNLIQAKGNKLSIEKVKELFPKARSSYFRNVSELLSFSMPNGEPLLRKIKEDEIEYIAINKSFSKDYIPDGEDNIFNLQALLKIGHLLDNSLVDEALKDIKDIYHINGKAKEINEKFYHLSRLSTVNDRDIYSSLLTALLKNYKVNFEYNSKSYEGYHLLSLCQYRDSLYVLAFEKKYSLSKVKTFKLSRFKAVTILEETFEYPSKWNVEDYFNKSSGIITGTENEAQIRVYRESRKQISERDFFNKALTESNDLYDEYVLSYSSTNEFLGQLFVYAQDIEIIGPSSLKDKFINKANNAIELNIKLAS